MPNHADKWGHLTPNQFCRLETTKTGVSAWLNPEGLPHRVDAEGVQDGPAVYFENYPGEAWVINGKPNRLDGPAKIYSQGNPEYFLAGVRMTPEEWAQDPRVVGYKSRATPASL